MILRTVRVNKPTCWRINSGRLTKSKNKKILSHRLGFRIGSNHKCKVPRTPFFFHSPQVISLNSLALPVPHCVVTTKCIVSAVSVKIFSIIVNKIFTQMIIKDTEMLPEDTIQKRCKLPGWLLHRLNNVLKEADSLLPRESLSQKPLVTLMEIRSHAYLWTSYWQVRLLIDQYFYITQAHLWEANFPSHIEKSGIGAGESTIMSTVSTPDLMQWVPNEGLPTLLSQI